MFFLLETGQLVCPGSAQMHQMNTESASQGVCRFPDAAVGGRVILWLLYHLAHHAPVKLCFAVSSDEVMQHDMASCDIVLGENEWVSQVTHQQPCFLKAFFFFSPAGKRRLKKGSNCWMYQTQSYKQSNLRCSKK